MVAPRWRNSWMRWRSEVAASRGARATHIRRQSPTMDYEYTAHNVDITARILVAMTDKE